MKEKIKKLIKKGKWLNNMLLTLLLIAIVVAVTVGINVFVEKQNISSIDLTKEKLYSLSQESKDKIKNINQETKIILYGMESYSDVTNYANLYNKENSNITTEVLSNALERPDLQSEYGLGTNTTNLIIVEAGNRKKAVMVSDLYTYDMTTYSQLDITEQALTNAILSVNLEKTPKIYLVTNHAAFANQFNAAKEYIKNDINEVEDLDLLVKGEVPDDCDLLIITTTKEDFSEYEKNIIETYVNEGKNLMILTEPNYGKVDLTNFNSLLSNYGVSISEGIIYESDSSKMLNGYANIILPELSTSSEITKHIATSEGIAMMNAGKLTVASAEELENIGVTTENIVTSGSGAFLRNDVTSTSGVKTGDDEDAGEEPIAVIATKEIEENKKSKLLIVGNSFFASDLTVQLYSNSSNTSSQRMGISFYYNKDFLLNSVAYLTQRDESITIRKDIGIVPYTSTDKQDKIIKIIIVALPIVVIATGIVVWIIRKRKK